MTVKTWKQHMEDNFTAEGIARFNGLFELHASSMQFERIAISNEQVVFVDSTTAGPVEDIVLKPKGNSPDQNKSSSGTYAIFLNVSDYEQILFELISLATRHDFDVERMLDEMYAENHHYHCEDVLFPSSEGEVSL